MSLHHGMLLWLMRQPISRTRNNCLFPSAGLPVITTFMKIYRLSPCPRQILRRINESTPWYAIMAPPLRIFLSVVHLSQCCGQAYDGASNMMGHLNGVATQI